MQTYHYRRLVAFAILFWNMEASPLGSVAACHSKLRFGYSCILEFESLFREKFCDDLLVSYVKLYQSFLGEGNEKVLFENSRHLPLYILTKDLLMDMVI